MLRAPPDTINSTAIVKPVLPGATRAAGDLLRDGFSRINESKRNKPAKCLAAIGYVAPGDAKKSAR